MQPPRFSHIRPPFCPDYPCPFHRWRSSSCLSRGGYFSNHSLTGREERNRSKNTDMWLKEFWIRNIYKVQARLGQSQDVDPMCSTFSQRALTGPSISKTMNETKEENRKLDKPPDNNCICNIFTFENIIIKAKTCLTRHHPVWQGTIWPAVFGWWDRYSYST